MRKREALSCARVEHADRIRLVDRRSSEGHIDVLPVTLVKIGVAVEVELAQHRDLREMLGDVPVVVAVEEPILDGERVVRRIARHMEVRQRAIQPTGVPVARCVGERLLVVDLEVGRVVEVVVRAAFSVKARETARDARPTIRGAPTCAACTSAHGRSRGTSARPGTASAGSRRHHRHARRAGRP